MPIKFKPSTYKNQGGISIGTHSYMKATSTKELLEYMESSIAKPKIKQKVSQELVRRGV